MKIFCLESKHLDIVIKAHLTTWGDTEFSVLLGENFVRNFYQFAIEDEYTLALGASVSDESQLACWCLGFTRYSDFNRRLRKSLSARFYQTVGHLILTRRLPIAQLIDQIFGPKPYRTVQCKNIHLGAFGKVGHRFEEVLILSKLVEHTAKMLCVDSTSCWAVTNIKNRGAQLILEKAKFNKTDDIRLSDRTLRVYQFPYG